MNARAKGNWQGMNWIRQDKRLAIYLRDGCACAWCGAAVEDGAQLTLDHLIPHSLGGSNAEGNLVTSCKRCNDSRGARAVSVFAKAVAEYLDHGIQPSAIEAHILACIARPLKAFRAEAQALMARRGSCFDVLQARVAS
jgi:HNH endonuclease